MNSKRTVTGMLMPTSSIYVMPSTVQLSSRSDSSVLSGHLANIYLVCIAFQHINFVILGIFVIFAAEKIKGLLLIF